MPRYCPKRLRLWAVVLTLGPAATVGIAAAATRPTVGVFKSLVTNFDSPNAPETSTQNIVGVAGGFPIYTLTGDSKNDPKCLSKRCRMIWPWVTIANGKTPTKDLLIKAKLGVWKHSGVSQLTLDRHPLYFFVKDKTKKRAHGEGIISFGGTWHVWKISSSSPTGPPSESPPPSIKASTSTSLSCPTMVTIGGGIPVSGKLSPPMATTVTITYTPPGGSSFTHVTTTDSSGNFSDSTTANQSGTWTIQASYAGSSQYTSSESPACTTSVGVPGY
jgi:predicted lipoprotein with Yx(FWY)xxD motif